MGPGGLSSIVEQEPLFDKSRDVSLRAGAQAQSYTNYFADALVAEAKRDSRIVGVHAAMGGGTGMNRVEKVRLRKPHA